MEITSSNGMMMRETTVRRHEAFNMKTITRAACARLRIATFRFNVIWSDTVVVSAARRLVISPAIAVKYALWLPSV